MCVCGGGDGRRVGGLRGWRRRRWGGVVRNRGMRREGGGWGRWKGEGG